MLSVLKQYFLVYTEKKMTVLLMAPKNYWRITSFLDMYMIFLFKVKCEPVVHDGNLYCRPFRNIYQSIYLHLVYFLVFNLSIYLSIFLVYWYIYICLYGFSYPLQKHNLALNKLLWLICHKTQPTNQPTNQPTVLSATNRIWHKVWF